MCIFKVKLEMDKSGLTTFFKYKIFTIPKELHASVWSYKDIVLYGLEEKYKFSIASSVKAKFNIVDEELSSIFSAMEEENTELIIINNNGARYDVKNQYIKCKIPAVLMGYFKRLFVSTIVYQAENMQIPQIESVTFTFDKKSMTAVISDLQLYRPGNNPYFKYAKNAVSSLSVEAIGLENYSIENTDYDKSDKINDFYNHSQISGWREVGRLKNETAIDDKPGIYMLYDKNNNTFYVGKAIKLKERIEQHRKNPTGNDPIPNFTHYRYSVVSGEYYKLLYLIENAAIHDLTWLLDMPEAKIYTPALVEIIGEERLASCKIVNTHEHQTKMQN